jgi:hypothetical protein
MLARKYAVIASAAKFHGLVAARRFLRPSSADPAALAMTGSGVSQ